MATTELKVGFDVSQTGNNKAGCGYFAANLISSLATLDTSTQYILYPTFGDHFWDKSYNKTSSFNQPNFQQGLKHDSLSDAKEFWQNPPSNWESLLGDVNILHANNFFCPPKLKQGKLIYTLYDMSFLEDPSFCTEHNRVVCFDGAFKASINADHIIAISHYSRNHFINTFPHYPPEKISVVHPGNRFPNIQDIKTRPSKKIRHLTQDQFWLYVGTIEPRKNIKRLIQSYAKLKKQQKGTYPLVLAGGKGWLMDDLQALINEYNLQKHIHLLGYVDNNDLQWLYQNCFCFLYPSLFEGFGLPVLEAMHYGSPVITSSTSSIPEIAGDACILINPTNENELFEAMATISVNEECRTNLRESGRKQANLFSWEIASKKILEIYKTVGKQPRHNQYSYGACELNPLHLAVTS